MHIYSNTNKQFKYIDYETIRGKRQNKIYFSERYTCVRTKADEFQNFPIRLGPAIPLFEIDYFLSNRQN